MWDSCVEQYYAVVDLGLTHTHIMPWPFVPEFVPQLRTEVLGGSCMCGSYGATITSLEASVALWVLSCLSLSLPSPWLRLWQQYQSVVSLWYRNFSGLNSSSSVISQNWRWYIRVERKLRIWWQRHSYTHRILYYHQWCHFKLSCSFFGPFHSIWSRFHLERRATI